MSDPKEVISLSFSDSLCGPSCVQCRTPMTLALCEPDFENPALMLATYRCAKVRSARARENRGRPALIRHAFEALNGDLQFSTHGHERPTAARLALARSTA